MKCIKDSVLMEYIAGKLDADRAEQVQKHLAECAKCSERLRDSSSLWETLGRWDVDTEPHNVADKVIAAAEKTVLKREASKRRVITERTFWLNALRIAASIAIAAGIGQALGRLSTSGEAHKPVQPQVEPRYIAALGLDWSSDFTRLVMEDDSSGLEKNNE